MKLVTKFDLEKAEPKYIVLINYKPFNLYKIAFFNKHDIFRMNIPLLIIHTSFYETKISYF